MLSYDLKKLIKRDKGHEKIGIVFNLEFLSIVFVIKYFYTVHNMFSKSELQLKAKLMEQVLVWLDSSKRFQ